LVLRLLLAGCGFWWETLVEAAVRSSPWLASRTFDCRCYAALGLADGL